MAAGTTAQQLLFLIEGVSQTANSIVLQFENICSLQESKPFGSLAFQELRGNVFFDPVTGTGVANAIMVGVLARFFCEKESDFLLAGGDL